MKYCNTHFGMYDEKLGCAYCPAVAVSDSDSFELVVRSYEERAGTSLPWARWDLSFQFMLHGKPVGYPVLSERRLEGVMSIVWESQLRYVGLVDGWVFQDAVGYCITEYRDKQPRVLSNQDKICISYKLG